MVFKQLNSELVNLNSLVQLIYGLFSRNEFLLMINYSIHLFLSYWLKITNKYKYFDGKKYTD